MAEAELSEEEKKEVKAPALEKEPGKEKVEVKTGLINRLKQPVSPLQTAFLLSLLVIGLGGLFLLVKFKTPPPVIPTSFEAVKKPLTLSLVSPADGELILGNQLLVKGKTLPNTTVVFFTETDENSVESDEDGQFEGALTLENGINTLTVNAFSEKGEEKEISLNVVYDEEESGSVKGVKKDKTPPGQAKKQTEASSVTVIGNVEEVTTDSLTVGKGVGKAKVTTKVDKETKIVGQDKKLLKLNTLSPDDIAAVITDDEESTESGGPKKAIKIFVKQATTKQMKRRAVHGIINTLGDEAITLVHQTQRSRTYTLFYNQETVIKIKGATDATSADLEVGQRIAAVGDLDEEGNLVAKRIHVIPGKATGVFEKQPFEATSEPEATQAATTVTPSPEATPTATLTTTPIATTSPSLNY